MTQWWHDDIHSVVSLYPVSLCSDYLRPQSLPRFCPASVEAAMTYIRLAGPAQAVLPAQQTKTPLRLLTTFSDVSTHKAFLLRGKIVLTAAGRAGRT